MNAPLLIFDIDGTLTDSVSAHQTCYTNALNERSLKKDGNFGDFKHHTDRYIFCEIFRQNNGRSPNNAEIQGFYQSIEKTFAEHEIKEIDGASDFLKLAQQQGIPYVFATGSIKLPALKKLAAVNITNAEHLLATSDETDSREEIVLESVKKACTYYQQDSFAAKIIFGDGKWDYITAQNLDMFFVGIGSNPVLSELLCDSPNTLWKNFNNRTYEDVVNHAIQLAST